MGERFDPETGREIKRLNTSNLSKYTVGTVVDNMQDASLNGWEVLYLEEGDAGRGIVTLSLPVPSPKRASAGTHSTDQAQRFDPGQIAGQPLPHVLVSKGTQSIQKKIGRPRGYTSVETNLVRSSESALDRRAAAGEPPCGTGTALIPEVLRESSSSDMRQSSWGIDLGTWFGYGGAVEENLKEKRQSRPSLPTGPDPNAPENIHDSGSDSDTDGGTTKSVGEPINFLPGVSMRRVSRRATAVQCDVADCPQLTRNQDRLCHLHRHV
jgi:hypothetical protein